MTAQPPEDDERISKRVVYEHTTSARQNTGVIIAIIVLALALVVFIVLQINRRPHHRSGELFVPTRSAGILPAGPPAFCRHSAALRQHQDPGAQPRITAGFSLSA